MENLRYYIRREMVGQILNEKVQERYSNVNFEVKEMLIKDLTLTVSTHRLLFTCDSHRSLLVDLSCILSVDMKEEGVFTKKRWLEVKTVFNDNIALSLKNLNEALVQIRGALNKGVWRLASQPAEQSKPALYAGINKHIENQKQQIAQKEQKIANSFTNFEHLFQNARELKEVIGFLKENLKAHDEAFQGKGEVDDILNNMGFVSTITKEEAGKDYYKQEAANIYKICDEVLFKQFGGMVPLLDLYYFYNKKRQTCLISPEELMKACRQFERMGLGARIVEYPNNVKMVESTTFDPVSDFQKNFMPFFSNCTPVKPDEISRKRNIPVVIVQLKIDQALKRGRIVKDDRIEGVRYFQNLILTMVA